MQACRTPDGMRAAELSAALAAELPAFKRDGGFVREGYDKALDETRALRDELRRVVAALQARYAEGTGIRALKIRHNNVLGYFVEVTAQHGEKLLSAPLNATFIHRQTLAGQVRFSTSELGEIEAKIANAGDRALGLELEIFERLSAKALDINENCVRPEVGQALGFGIERGRHPVVEQALNRNGEPFIANACDLSPA